MIAKSVDEIFDRELLGDTRIVAEQVADGVVVLRVGEAAQHWLTLAAAFGNFECIGGLSVGDEVIGPGAEDGFVSAAGDDALAAGMSETRRGFVEQNRLRGIGAVDQRVEREAEAGPFLFRQFAFRNFEPGASRDAAAVVAAFAICLVEHGQNLRGEVSLAGRAMIFLRGQQQEREEEDGDSHYHYSND